MKKYILLLIAGLLVGITTNIGHPITPYYINQIELDKIIFGYFYAAMSFGMLISAPIWGALGDARGRKIVLLICVLFYGVGQLLFGILHNQYLIIAARLFSGIFSGGILVSLLSYMTRSNELSKFNGPRLYATFISIHLVGTSLGSFIGGALGEVFNPNYHYVFFVQALTMVLFALYVLIFMKFDERYIQTVYFTLLISNRLFNSYNEYPCSNGYIDLMFFSNSELCKYDIMIELKYLKVKEYRRNRKLLGIKREEAIEQLKSYSQS